MTRPQTIVAAIDFSTPSKVSLTLAADLAERAGAVLHLVHADVLFRSGTAEVPDATPSATLRLQLERFAADALGPDGAEIAVVRDVAPAAAILRHVSEVDADLVVVGTHGRSGVTRLLLGSVAEAVVAVAPCPVLSVPGEAVGLSPSPDAPVLVAVDFSERSRAVLAAGRALAELYGAPVELVHVVRGAGPYPPFAPELLSVTDVDPGKAGLVRERLRRFAGGATDAPPAECHLAYGTPSRVVPALAVERGVGAIVMGTHGRTGLARIIGSVAEATLHRAPCPVLTLKEVERLGGPSIPVRSALAS
ncbi:universal stress protein [Rubrivirga sp.]|uniref:universal stress protein n=1 Tax=Rubrivirga sp. TaxID=1885344 RepID=UPI003C743610